MIARLFTFFVLACHIAMAGTGDVLRCIADIRSALDKELPGISYDVTAQIIYPGIPGKYEFVAKDDTGYLKFGVNPAAKHECPTNAGDIVRIRGVTIPDHSTSQKSPPGFLRIGADCRRIERIGHVAPETPLEVSGMDFYNRPELCYRFLRLKGTIHDLFRDEIDPKFVFLVLVCDEKTIYMAILCETASDDELNCLVGSTVSAEGIAIDNAPGCRTRLGRILNASNMNAVKVIASSSTDPFAVSELAKGFHPHATRPPKIDRCRVSGHVIAVWNNGERILMRTASGDLIRADIKTYPPPRYGEHIEVAGIPETDLYHINLSRTLWRATSGPILAESPPLPVSLPDIWVNQYGMPYKNAWFHGYAVRIHGIVRSLPAVGDDKGRMYLESDSFMVPVDCSSCPGALDGIVQGSRVEVSGTYITETDIW